MREEDKDREFCYFIGVDVSKENLQVHCLGEEVSDDVFSTDKKGWQRFCEHYQSILGQAIVIVETTGWYEKGFLQYLIEQAVYVHRAAARQVKQFMASYGTVAKTDKIDAEAIARYGKERHHTFNPYKALDEQQDQLYILQARRVDLTQMLVKEKNRLKAPGYKEIQRSIQRIIETIEGELASIIEQMKDIVRRVEHLKQKYKTLQTIEGIGEITALSLMAAMPELGTMNRRQAASLAGLAPHPKDSGKTNGYRRTRGGRSQVKDMLHMAALGAAHKKGSKLQKFYKHLIQDNQKKPMVALTAVKRKLITIANAKIRDLNLSQKHS